MTEDKDKLLESFFRKAAERQLEDDGFSDKVMSQIESSVSRRVRRMQRLWTAVCIILGILIVMKSDCVDSLLTWAFVAMKTFATYDWMAIGLSVLLVPLVVSYIIAAIGLIENEKLTHVSYP